MRIVAAAVALAVAVQPAAASAATRPFEVRAPDGVVLKGQADTPARPSRAAVIFVPGTGGFDRDAAFGPSGAPLFKDIAARMNARGVSTVRYDLRGIRHGVPSAERLDLKLLGGRTTTSMRDDLRAVYDWTLSRKGLGATCVIFFAHSEGVLHVARLAEAGAPSPLLVIGMGAPMESAQSVFKWQAIEREAHSIELMDANRDGRTTEAEVRGNIGKTPAAVFGVVEPFLLPGGWGAPELAILRANKQAGYAKARADDLARRDADLYPDATNAFASYQWWKSWYLDDVPAAARLARWRAPLRMHYGDRDSQVNPERQKAALAAALPASRYTVAVHPARGHSLGEHVLVGPIDPKIADRIADEATAAARSCR